ncbi:hypothetical protein J3Q64DRAFT_1709802 [Phycomyces blakesleeanus]|uniref:Uncharacterized protein n=1 Tax=Phycomyces blakesleeanus TaxID=4837 RepID=A0ABR3BDB9_PHYBL
MLISYINKETTKQPSTFVYKYKYKYNYKYILSPKEIFYKLIIIIILKRKRVWFLVTIPTCLLSLYIIVSMPTNLLFLFIYLSYQIE